MNGRFIGCGFGLCGADARVRGVGQFDETFSDIPSDFGDASSLLGETFTDIPSDVASSAADAGGGGLFSSVGDFFGSTFGSALTKAGLGLGTTYLGSQLLHPGTSPTTRPNVPGGASPGTTGTHGGSAPAGVPSTPDHSTPEWVMPVAIIGGLAVVALILTRR